MSLQNNGGHLEILNGRPAILKKWYMENSRLSLPNFILAYQNIVCLFLFSDENQLTFTCHWRCGMVALSETPVYELVEIQGTFRKLDTDGCKF